MPWLWIVAEVMDKEPTVVRIWLFGIGSGVVMFLLALMSRRSFIGVLPLSLFLAYAIVSETWDAQVAPAILEEAGYAYMVQCYLAALLIVTGAIAGVLTAFYRAAASLPNNAAAGDGGPAPTSTGARRV